MEKKRLHIPSEIIYVLAVVILAFSVCLATAADFGVSMIVAPAYILSIKFPVLTFGQWEWVTQAILFVIFCIIMRRFHWAYLVSFFTCLFYGAVLDLWRLIPIFNPTFIYRNDFVSAASIKTRHDMTVWISSDWNLDFMAKAEIGNR